MPPKRKLPRRGRALEGELNLDAVSNERIDAVTAEPLDPVKFIEVLSPDKTLRLFYNTSTLIRIAVDNGGFMQPPHFREPMSNALRKRIEDTEGKKFHFESRNTVIRGDEAGDDGQIAVLHRHVYFDQIMDEFYLLNPAEVYVCPMCYEHYLQTRFLPARTEEGRPVKRLQSGLPVVDPLDVLSHMHGEDPSTGDAENGVPIVLDTVWDNVLVHIVFRRAAQWKTHMETHHWVRGVSAGDYRLRDVLCTYYNHYNQWNEEKHDEEVRLYGSARKKAALTLQRYWHINASYNRLRYNRVVAATELAEGHAEAVTESAFPNETVAHHFNPEVEDEDDFINDDTDEDDSVPPYLPDREAFDDEEDVTDTSEDEPRQQRRKRNRERSAESETVSSQSRSSSTTTSSTDSDYAAEVEKQRALFKRGLLAERDCYFSRLSAEDRHFFEKSSRSNVTPSQLYDPCMHLKNTPASTLDNNIDWENIGETLPIKNCLKLKKERSASLPHVGADLELVKTKLLLDEDEASPLCVDQPQLKPGRPSSRMLLDDDE
ncbi:conserved hypothetical protein [Leishmania mexicana MHOM/GT/2001/U1103]|uniref:DUF4211 domain-containing protein n=1 Tax=Leishmania mexicana (strain MHOM/GT/2001/U1103) TaxID=929439 RepID=E9AQF5_LEIMU|nr:conserved hypothetical protein [Leishmania mexicana MHOM/GT/2001/U1103]CBZ25174.1 conserved hypothetical protein [Leishmania mexicana MHOM/GT/2001/U1103]